MKRILMLSLLTLVVPACISASKAPTQTSLEKIESLPLGSTHSQALVALGAPSTKEFDESDEIWTYSVQYKKIMLPEMKLTFSKSGLLVEKNINVYGLDGIRIFTSDLKKRYPQNQFVAIEETYATSNHSFSRRGLLKDEKAGVFADYNTARNNQIQTIRWVSQRTAASN